MRKFILISSEQEIWYLVITLSRLKGRTHESIGEINTDKYVGGCISMDSMSSFLHVEYRLEFSGSETIRGK